MFQVDTLDQILIDFPMRTEFLLVSGIILGEFGFTMKRSENVTAAAVIGMNYFNLALPSEIMSRLCYRLRVLRLN